MRLKELAFDGAYVLNNSVTNTLSFIIGLLDTFCEPVEWRQICRFVNRDTRDVRGAYRDTRTAYPKSNRLRHLEASYTATHSCSRPSLRSLA
jgi:hypothetical protein